MAHRLLLSSARGVMRESPSCPLFLLAGCQQYYPSVFSCVFHFVNGIAGVARMHSCPLEGHNNGLMPACVIVRFRYSSDTVSAWTPPNSSNNRVISTADNSSCSGSNSENGGERTSQQAGGKSSDVQPAPAVNHERQVDDSAGVFTSMHEAALRPESVRRLDLTASPQLQCKNLLCDEVGGPCICKVSR